MYSTCTHYSSERETKNAKKENIAIAHSRNNGFLIVLATMKRRARELVCNAKLLPGEDRRRVDASSVGDTSVDYDGTRKENEASDDATTRAMYNAMMESLQQLQPPF
jgi:hypothetical protein